MGRQERRSALSLVDPVGLRTTREAGRRGKNPASPAVSFRSTSHTRSSRLQNVLTISWDLRNIISTLTASPRPLLLPVLLISIPPSHVRITASRPESDAK